MPLTVAAIAVTAGALVGYWGAVHGPAGPYPTLRPWFPLGLSLFVFLVVWIARWAWWTVGPSFGCGGYASSCAREILRTRYARGEIDRSQFLSMSNDLDAFGEWD